MSISGINSGLGLYNPSSTHKFTKQPALSPEVRTKMSDTVSLSKDAKGLYRNSHYADLNDPKVKADLEALALPDWFGPLLPKEAVFDPETAMSTPYREHYSVTGINKKEIDYCRNKLSDVFSEETIKTGISSDERYSMKTSQPDQFKEYDDKFHQAVRNRLLADEHYVKYMEFLGITI